MARSSGTETDRRTVEAMLGRRLRPWWGQPPGRLLARGLVQGAVSAGIVYGAVQVRGGELDLAGSGLEEQRDTIDQVALVVGIIAVIGIVYSLVRVVVGAIDLVSRHTVEGTLVGVAERRRGDFLPGPLQWWWYRRRTDSGHDREVYRRRRHEIVVATAEGEQSWTIDVRTYSRLESAPPGQPVVLRATPLLGHVRGVDIAPAGSGSPPGAG